MNLPVTSTFYHPGWAIWRGLMFFYIASCGATAGPKFLPVLNHPIKDRHGLAGLPFGVDLNTAFGMEPIDDQVVRFTSQFNSDGGQPVVLDFTLFSNRTPGTRANFLKYVTDGDYANSFIHRSVPGFVIQGGGFRIINNSIESVPTDPPIINEFSISNTLGTVSMAKLGGDPDSATSQWFISLGANSDILDPQNGGFSVFGRVTRDTFPNAQLFGNPSVFGVYDYSENFGVAFKELPLYPPNYLILFPIVSMAPLPAGQAGESTALAYSIVSNSNPAVATASIQPPATLSLVAQAGQTGTTQITVRATDSVGNTVDDTFLLTVNAADTYATWASRTVFPGEQNGIIQNPDNDSLSNLQEYAFLGDPSSPSEKLLPILGSTGIPPAPQYLTLTFPVRKFTSALTYAVLAGDSLQGPWSTIWTSTDGFGHPQVVATVEQVDRTLVTIKDTVAINGSPKRFLRTRVTQE